MSVQRCNKNLNRNNSLLLELFLTYCSNRTENGISHNVAEVFDEVHRCCKGIHGAADDVS